LLAGDRIDKPEVVMTLSLIPWRTRFPLLSRRGDNFADWVERFFEEPIAERLPEAFRGNLFPALNVAEDNKAMTITIELPGLEEKDIQVNVTGTTLTVSGERKWEEVKKDKQWHRVESQFGSFTRTVTLPNNLKTDQIEAVYNKGLLTLTIPKVEPTPTTKVKIKAQ
jgi:HSP20 family protein